MTEGLVFLRRSAPEARLGDFHELDLDNPADVSVGQRYRVAQTGEEIIVERVSEDHHDGGRADTRSFRPRVVFARCRGTRATAPPIQQGAKLVYIGRVREAA